jgi:acylphosphatase
MSDANLHSGDRVVRVVVRGRVQGVGFRAWVHEEAERHGLGGWVRNRRDGTVEAVFSGPAELVESMIRACRRGPSLARVDAVDTEEGARKLLPGPGSGRFEVLRTE